MIELPLLPAPNGATPSIIDYGGTIRPSLGGPIQRVSRTGSRFKIAVTFPPFDSVTEGRIFVSRLLRAKEQGIRIPFPLMGVSQGAPGAPAVAGAGQAGRLLALRGLTPSYAAKEGYWLSIEDTDGQHYLHNVAGAVIAAPDGTAALPIETPLRKPFADGCKVHLTRPMIEGIVDGAEWAWQMSVDNLIGLEFTIEEAA